MPTRNDAPSGFADVPQEQAAWWGLVLGAAVGAGLVLALLRLPSPLRTGRHASRRR